ncbi:transcriptional regulator [Kutzneria sp. 744]|nr:transcriptional regulator [Kutzneria sp. 744]
MRKARSRARPRGLVRPGTGRTPRDGGVTLAAVDTRVEVRDFLTSRRAKITPDDVGLVSYGTRQVLGLRREEVATLAGISIDYYNRMERGNLAGVSDDILAAVARALRLDPAERAHLADLARASRDHAAGRRPGPSRQTVPPSIEWMIDAMTGAAAFVANNRQDVLAANRLGRALFAPMFESAARANMARFTYLDPAARNFFADWDRIAKECVAALRAQAGRNPFDRDLHDLVGELSAESADFAALWAIHDVRHHFAAEKAFHHPRVGRLVLRYDRLAVTAAPGLEIFAYMAEPGSPSAAAIDILAGQPVA